MKPSRSSLQSLIIRVGGNCHRFVAFVNGKFRCFTTHEKDFLFNLAALFGVLNQRFSKPAHALRFLTALVLSVLFACPVAFALPTGWEVVSGDVTFDQQGSTLNVTSASQQAIVNYQSFNVGAGETVNFNFLLSGSSILNRVIGGGASSIAGAINGNGAVYLINPAGINFAQSANVNVGSLVASTLNIANQDYLNGHYVFKRDGAASGITNAGRITAGPEGHVLLLGSAIQNNGTITAPRVALAVGEQVTVAMGQDLSLQVTVDEALKEKVESYQAAIGNAGAITAEQSAELKAQVDSALYQQVVNNEGVISATGIAQEGGKIVLFAQSTGQDALVNNVGTLQAAGGDVRVEGDLVAQSGDISVASDTGQGGTIDVLGDAVALLDDAHLDASGKTGGGAIHVGGDYQGQGDTRRARWTYVDSGVRLDANATESGNGGQVVVWSDARTDYFGEISATGGAASGNGGNAEISGKQWLNFNGGVDLSAQNGDKGSLLLDPDNLLIASPLLWLDASQITGLNDGDNVTLWSDSSGNGYNATLGAFGTPTYVANGPNGMAAVYFDAGGDQLLINGLNAGSDTTMFFMVDPDTTTPVGIFQTAPFMPDAYRNYNSGQWEWWNQDPQANLGLADANPVLLSFSSRLAPGRAFDYYQNGTFVNTYTSANTNPIAWTTPELGIINNPWTASYSGSTSEILIFNHNLNNTELQMVNQYLGNKYGIAVTGASNTSLITQNQLETLSQTANIVLQADNDIVFAPLKNNVLNLQGNASLSVTAGNSVVMRIADTLRTEGGAITVNGGNLTLGNLDTTGAGGNKSAAVNLTANAGTVTVNDVATGGGDFTLTGRSPILNGNLDAGGGMAVFNPVDASRPIRVAAGADDDVNFFDLSAAEMARIKADTLFVGDVAVNADIDLAGDIDVTGLDGQAGVYNLAFNTAGNFNANGFDINLGRDAIYFDGVDDYILVPDPGNYSLDVSGNTVTMMAWIRPSSSGATYKQIINKDLSYELALRDGGELWGAIQPAWVDMGNTSTSVGQWQHVALVDDGSNLTFYINGNPVEVIPLADGAIAPSNFSFRIGARETFGVGGAAVLSRHYRRGPGL